MRRKGVGWSGCALTPALQRGEGGLVRRKGVDGGVVVPSPRPSPGGEGGGVVPSREREGRWFPRRRRLGVAVTANLWQSKSWQRLRVVGRCLGL